MSTAQEVGVGAAGDGKSPFPEGWAPGVLKQRVWGSAVLRARVEYLDPEGGANCSPGCLSDASVARCGRVRLKRKPPGRRTEPRVQLPLALPKSHDLRPVWLRARALQAGGAVVGPLCSGKRRSGSRSGVGVGFSPPGKEEPRDCGFPGAPRSVSLSFVRCS